MKKFASLLLVTVFSVIVWSNGITVGFVAHNMGADSNTAAYEGMKSYADFYGWNINLVDCQGDPTRLSPAMIDMINSGVDAIVVCCGEAALIGEGVDYAEKAGIPVFLEDTENVGNTIVNATSNCWAMGAYLASQVVNQIRLMENPTGNVAIIGMPDLYVHRQREQMLQAVFNSPENPDINVIAVEAVNVSNWAEESYNIARIFITRYGNDLDAIIGTWDGIGWGISRAIADSGFTSEDIFTMSIDGSQQTYDLIRRGEPFVGVIAQDFAGWSEVVGDAIRMIVVEGKDPKEIIPENRTIYVPYEWIDKSNVPPEGENVNFTFTGLDDKRIATREK